MLLSSSHRLVAALLFDHVRLMVVGKSSAMERSSPQDPRDKMHISLSSTDFHIFHEYLVVTCVHAFSLSSKFENVGLDSGDGPQQSAMTL